VRVSKKTIREIQNISFAMKSIESVGPRYRYDLCWWDEPPQYWTEEQIELWDVVYDLEDRVKAEVLKILGVTAV